MRPDPFLAFNGVQVIEELDEPEIRNGDDTTLACAIRDSSFAEPYAEQLDCQRAEHYRVLRLALSFGDCRGLVADGLC